MILLGFFRRRRSAPVARERLQSLLAYERRNRNQPDVVAILREEIMAVIAKYVRVEQNQIRVAMDRGERTSSLKIDVHIPHKGTVAAAAF